MLNVLLTGAGGFIGSHLYDGLKVKDRVTRIVSDKQCVATGDCYSVNLASQNSVESLIETLSKAKFECDVIIHLASRMASPACRPPISLSVATWHVTLQPSAKQPLSTVNTGMPTDVAASIAGPMARES